MKKISIQSVILISFSVLFLQVSCTSAPIVSRPSELSYTYSRLKLQDIDEMTEIMQTHLKEYRQSKEEQVLKEALLISLSRPNDDNLLEKMMNSVRYAIESNDQWEKLVTSVVENSLQKLHDPTTAPEDQVTYLTALYNLLLEYKPEFSKPDVSPVFEKRITSKIAASNVVVSKLARKESSLNYMYALPSPSDVARTLLDEIARSEKPKKQ